MVKGEMKNWSIEDWNNYYLDFISQDKCTVEEVRKSIDILYDVILRKEEELTNLKDTLRTYEVEVQTKINDQYDGLYRWLKKRNIFNQIMQRH